MALTLSCSLPVNELRRGNLILKQEFARGNSAQVILTYTNLQALGFHGDNYTFPVLFKAVSHIPFPTTGSALHGQAVITGFSSHEFVQTALITMYSEFGDIGSATRVFEGMSRKDLVACNSILDVYARHGMMDDAVEMFAEMPVKDQISYNIMLSGYATSGLVDSAERFFDEIPVRDVVSWNSMISAYAKADKICAARALFDRMPERNVVTWNIMLSGLIQSKDYGEVVDLFHDMRIEGPRPNHITFASVLSACAHLGSLDIGEDIDIYARELGLNLHPHVAVSLIDMYSKCGSIERALEVFYKTDYKDIYCWNAMISGLAFHGHAQVSINLFHEMQSKGLRPDDITFIGLLSACSHAGLLTEGCHFFHTMEEEHGLSPKPEHYGCMTDLLGRAGQLARAHELIKSMPFGPCTMASGALLSACMIHGDLEVGEAVADRMAARGDCMSDGEYMMLVNMYSKCGRWEEASKWREMMNRDQTVAKTAGWSMIEVGGRMHKFLAGNIH